MDRFFQEKLNACFVALLVIVVRRVEWTLNLKGLGWADFRRSLSEHFSLLIILVGSTLFTFTAGPFENWDTSYEYLAAQGVLKWGLPYTTGVGVWMNEPPLGYYIDSAAFRVFGLSLDVGVAVITCFGLGCVLLVYLIGKAWYGKTAGLLAAVLFAVTPWQVVFSRSFLIDTQCLFFSLLFLLIGFYAIRKDSLGLFMLSGVFLGVAFLTKFYAIFMLFPLAILYFHKRPKRLRHPLVVAAFFLPLIALLLFWYEGVYHQSILTMFSHDDFNFYNTAGSTPSYFFTLNFLTLNLGLLFCAATLISLLISPFQKKLFRNIVGADLICLATILLVVGIDAVLALGLNLKSPYGGVIKYDYQALPFFCLLAGSLLSKSQSLLATLKLKRDRLLFVLACAGLICLGVAIFSNLYYINLYSQSSYILFKVEGQVGYSFTSTLTLGSTSLVYVQYMGFALLVLGLIWAVKNNFTKSFVEAPKRVP
jgi:4-amino-4-deoxy-L-arabinose transferase-like glycosyltransferase